MTSVGRPEGSWTRGLLVVSTPAVAAAAVLVGKRLAASSTATSDCAPMAAAADAAKAAGSTSCAAADGRSWLGCCEDAAAHLVRAIRAGEHLWGGCVFTGTRQQYVGNPAAAVSRHGAAMRELTRMFSQTLAMSEMVAEWLMADRPSMHCGADRKNCNIHLSRSRNTESTCCLHQL
jgi:hypothetical protein